MRNWPLMVFVLAGLLMAGTAAAQSGESTDEPVVPITATPAPIVVNPLLGFGTTPPLDLELPEDWEIVLRDTFTYQDLVPDGDGQLETLPIDVYQGPVSGGEGWIVMLWGYDSLVPFDPTLNDESFRERAAWLDGLRMLQFVVFDARCNIGTAPQREYSIGGLPAIGTTFSAVDCPFNQPDTRGWFAALNVDGLNFAFFAYADPIQPAGSFVEHELQAILDTVVFRVEDITITADEFQATREAIIMTPRPTLIFEEATPQTTPTP